MTEQPQHGMTMASRGAGHHPDPRPVDKMTAYRLVAIRIERVAQALCDVTAADHGTYDWAEASEELQDDYRRAARHAIAAITDDPENGHPT